MYEIEVLEIIERTELYHEQGIFKYPIKKAPKSERAKPTDLDHVVFDIKIYQK